MLVDFTHYYQICSETKILVLQQRHFYNFDAKNFQSPPSVSDIIGTALTFINLPLSSQDCIGYVSVSIIDSNFTNCTKRSKRFL